MTVKLFGLEFADEEERDRALLELKEALDRITEAERLALLNIEHQNGVTFAESCCGKCPSNTCYIDQMTGA